MVLQHDSCFLITSLFGYHILIYSLKPIIHTFLLSCFRNRGDSQTDPYYKEMQRTTSSHTKDYECEIIAASPDVRCVFCKHFLDVQEMTSSVKAPGGEKFLWYIFDTITKCFAAADPRLVFCTRNVPSLIENDCMSTIKKSLAICEFSCRYDARYVGRTSQRLGDRVKHHVPSNIRHPNFWQKEQPPRNSRHNQPLNTILP